ncbi:uncharacterized protein MELLADRAFT_71486 [Melampsora larici-populina 98AG31]|uniref:AB hydrolase-1 domain-containing protein n=1 Tax=Melampsora larici-populina (strain 98AG31 / pathotype 3-4-7) TaxID=747676 RepID=F4RHI8_MELLP|nr:uncharacterized protein MELLADRAFT_71486 [Melampsora larici-populina 98AG31]EGG08351.1 hypothetical protein MELLADRAFT_71486 [Melampsora larici-populina 98AG31]
MPHAQVSPGTTLYYEIKPCTQNPTLPETPWLLIVHPLYQDISCITHLSEDPVLRANFNVILFDDRYHGRSESSPSACFDCYTQAADLAMGMELLKIPNAHCMSTHPWATEVLLRMGFVFKEKVTSLCLCSLPSDQEDDFNKKAFAECFNHWTDPETPDDWHEAVASTVWYHFGSELEYDVDILDEYAGIFLRRYPPSNSVGQLMGTMPYSMRDVIPAKAQTSVTQPILILQGGADKVYTRSTLGVSSRLDGILQVSSKNELRTIPNAPLMLCRTHSVEVRNQFMQWIQPILSEQGRHSSTRLDLEVCLQRLASLSDDISITKRDPHVSDSYHLAGSEKIKDVSALLQKFEHLQKTKFSFIGGGAPETWSDASFEDIHPWRFSSRYDYARMFGSSEGVRSRTNSAVTLEESIEVVVMDSASEENFTESLKT